MRYDSAIELRDYWLGRLRDERTIAADATDATPESAVPQVAVGVTGRDGNYRLAIRVTRLDTSSALLSDAMTEAASGEVDILEIGEVEGIALPVRPLLGGISVGNRLGEAGTLGCLVRKRGTSTPCFILSNNHVLARLNFATPHEVIEQPALFDQTGAGPFEVAEFGETVDLKPTANVIDAAIAPLLPNVNFNKRALFGTTELIAGQRIIDLNENEAVFKIGKTTGKTTGTIKAWGISGLQVKLGSQTFEFNEQIEIQPDLTQFCDSGDSGSIVIDKSNSVLGLLFSKSRATEIAYANPIDRVFSGLDIELA